MTDVHIGDTVVGNTRPLTVIAGPCALENPDLAQHIAGTLKEACAAAGAQYIFKASYDKANRTSLSARRGIGMDEGLKALQSVKETIGVPVLTDVHNEAQCAAAAEVVDVLQIPAFLCRQTDMLLAAGETGRAVNVKKGQWLAPWEMTNVADKIASTGNTNILLTERGNAFGYNTWVTDMRGLPQMAQTGYPVVMDATHAVAAPGGRGTSSGGHREFAPVLARAAVAIGVAAVFMETHPDPDSAPSDGPNMIYLDDMPGLVDLLMQLDAIAKASPVRI